MGWIRLKRERWFTFSAGVCATLLAVGLVVLRPGWLDRIDLVVLDQQVAVLPVVAPSDAIVVVTIDDRSLSRYGQWPWPRFRIARLLERLRDMGALAVGVDIFFPERDRSSPMAIEEFWSDELGTDVRLEGIPEDRRDNDRILTETLGSGPFVLSHHLRFDGPAGEMSPLRTSSIICVSPPELGPCATALDRASGTLASLPEMMEAAPGAGFITIWSDPDGMIRRAPLIMALGDRLIPSLGLETLLMALGKRSIKVLRNESGLRLSIASMEFPLGDRGGVWLNFGARA